MDISRFVFNAYLVCLSLWTRSALSEETVSSPSLCPKHQGNDPSDVDDRLSKFVSQDTYTTGDHDYKYMINICQKNNGDTRAVQQRGLRWTDTTGWITVAQYAGAHVTGGTDWLMIKYFHGEKYAHHCSGVERIAVVLITCDPGEQRGTMKIIEEYRNSSKADNPLECYYLFQLNHDAACSVLKPKLLMSPSSFCLIILIVMGLVYFIFGFLYQRYIVGAKGLEQIPNCCFWTKFGCLQAGDGCNCLCPCYNSHPTTNQAWTTQLTNDDQEDYSLPMLM